MRAGYGSTTTLVRRRDHLRLAVRNAFVAFRVMTPGETFIVFVLVLIKTTTLTRRVPVLRRSASPLADSLIDA